MSFIINKSSKKFTLPQQITANENVAGTPAIQPPPNFAGSLYFVVADDVKQKVEIQFLPKQLSVQRNSTAQAITIVGRNQPLYQHSAGETVLSLMLDFYTENQNRQDVKYKCQWFESLTYTDGFNKPPSNVMLIWGDLYNNELWFVKRVNYTMSNFNPIYGFLPQQASIELVLALDNEDDTIRSDFL